MLIISLELEGRVNTPPSVKNMYMGGYECLKGYVIWFFLVHDTF